MADEDKSGSSPRACIPDRFYFHTEAINSGEYSELVYSRGALRFRAGVVFRQTPYRQFQCTADAGAWSRFWQRVDQIGVWNWKPDYTNSLVQGGLKWNLEIGYAGRALKTGGQRSYPGSNGPGYTAESEFGQFLAAVQALAGVSEFSW